MKRTTETQRHRETKYQVAKFDFQIIERDFSEFSFFAELQLRRGELTVCWGESALTACMIRQLIRAIRLGVAAAFAIVFPGGVVSFVQSDDMVRLSSPLSLDAKDLDFSTRVESHRKIDEDQFDDGGSPAEVNPPQRSDWTDPLG